MHRHSLCLLYGIGNGTFGAASNYSAGGTAYGIALADFNLDGKMDVFVSNNNTNGVSVVLGNGIAFGAPTTYSVGTTPLFLVAGDWNGDGKPDLAVANNGSTFISVILNTSK